MSDGRGGPKASFPLFFAAGLNQHFSGPRQVPCNAPGPQACRSQTRRRPPRALRTTAMPLQSFQNTFAGNPLDRASDRRGNAEWLAQQLASAESLGIAMWNGRPLVERTKDGGVQIAYLPSRLVGELAG